MPVCVPIASTQSRHSELMLTLKVSNCLKHTQGRLTRDGTHLQGAHTAGEQSLVLMALLRCVQSMLVKTTSIKFGTDQSFSRSAQ